MLGTLKEAFINKTQNLRASHFVRLVFTSRLFPSKRVQHKRTLGKTIVLLIASGANFSNANDSLRAYRPCVSNYRIKGAIQAEVSDITNRFLVMNTCILKAS